MKTSLKGRMAIARHEGIVLSRYKDAVTVWTIGVGHTRGAGDPDPQKITWKLSMKEVFDLLSKDLSKFEARVNKHVTVPLSQNQFDALVSFDFNTGAINRATLTKKLNAGDYQGAAAQFGLWNKAGGRTLSALVQRRKEERAVFERGAYGDAVATIYPADPNGRVLWSKGKRVNLLTLLAHDSVTDIPDTIPPVKPKPYLFGALANLARLILDLFKGK